MPKSSSRLKKLSTTGTLEFLRLLKGGDGPLLHFPQQHSSTVAELLASHRLLPGDAAAILLDLTYTTEFGHWSPRAAWKQNDSIAKLPPEAIAALRLQVLCTAIQSGWYQKQELLVRLTLRNHLLALWFEIFVAPELEARGRSKTRSEQRNGSAEFAKLLNSRHVPREAAKEQLVSKYAIGSQRANKLLRAAGYTGTRGRKRSN